jgi:dipeptidyl aminopeptidase/acylaminoacyl peptidase
LQGEADDLVGALWLSGDGKSLVLRSLPEPERFRLLEARTGKERLRFRAPTGLGNAAALAPDGSRLAVAGVRPGRDGAAVHVIDLATGREALALPDAGAAVGLLAFAPDGRRLLSGAYDGELLVWEVEPRPWSKDEAEGLWKDLADADAARAWRATARLTAAPSAASALLGERLKPMDEATLKRLRGWIADLDSDDFAVRRRAEEALEKQGDLAEAALRRALEDGPTLEQRVRLRRLLDRLEDVPPSPGRLRLERAVEALERAAAPEARRLLEALAKGPPGDPLTEEARAALRRRIKMKKDG